VRKQSFGSSSSFRFESTERKGLFEFNSRYASSYIQKNTFWEIRDLSPGIGEILMELVLIVESTWYHPKKSPSSDSTMFTRISSGPGEAGVQRICSSKASISIGYWSIPKTSSYYSPLVVSTPFVGGYFWVQMNQKKTLEEDKGSYLLGLAVAWQRLDDFNLIGHLAPMSKSTLSRNACERASTKKFQGLVENLLVAKKTKIEVVRNYLSVKNACWI